MSVSATNVEVKPWVITYEGKTYNVSHYTKHAAIERFLEQRVSAEDGDEIELELDGQKYHCEARVEVTWEIMKKDWE